MTSARTMTSPDLLLARLRTDGLSLGVAESLTGGALAASLVAVPGSSVAFRGGVVSYATDLKAALLGVRASVLTEYGAVHPQVAIEMADGAQLRLGVDLALATTGVAGPREQDGHAVGTVFLAAALAGAPTRVRGYRLGGSRADIRQACVGLALALGLSAIS